MANSGESLYNLSGSEACLQERYVGSSMAEVGGDGGFMVMVEKEREWC